MVFFPFFHSNYEIYGLRICKVAQQDAKTSLDLKRSLIKEVSRLTVTRNKI